MKTIIFACNTQIVPPIEAIRFLETEFSVTKNENLILNASRFLSEMYADIKLTVVSLPANGTLISFREGLQYRPEPGFIGEDRAMVSVSLASDPNNVIITATLTFRVLDNENYHEVSFFENLPCNFIPITDRKVNRYFFIPLGGTVSFNALKDVMCEEVILEQLDFFKVVILNAPFPQYGTIKFEDHVFTYENNLTSGSKLDRIIYEISYFINGQQHVTQVIAFFLVENPCILGYTPNIDYYTIAVGNTRSIVLPFFHNDFLCGLSMEEIKKSMTVFSFGTLEFPLDPDWTPVGNFDLNTLTFTTNVTPHYFDKHPDAYARAYVHLNYKARSGGFIESLIVVKIIR